METLALLKSEFRSEVRSESIIGRSKALRDVLEQVGAVAPADTTVLVLGETGTGKELIARAIHEGSPRRSHKFIKMDCTAISASLMESELFGHEKGAFTGAVAQRIGRLEVADKGTLFLDEIGDVPLELQTKLLRVLQDQTFERVGSNRTQHVDIRIISATNRNLESMIERGKFREDLYFRLRVFPIIMPALRDRGDDIPALVRHYVAKYAQRMHKHIHTIPPEAMETFIRYHWPGNVRELQHFMERSVVLSSNGTLQAPLMELEHTIQKRLTGKQLYSSRKLEDIERESILQALRDSDWIVGGSRGAAVKLGLKRTTLVSRIESLGITRHKQ